MGSESFAKAYVLAHGVHFTDEALRLADQMGAKRQNAVYNLPRGTEAPGRPMGPSGRYAWRSRPQELLIRGEDGYAVCVSAVAPPVSGQPAVVAEASGRLCLVTPAKPEIGEGIEEITFVGAPGYYGKKTRRGNPIIRWVSACGCDELNVWPWHDCAIGGTCSFCGINSVHEADRREKDLLRARDLALEVDGNLGWERLKATVLSEIEESIEWALRDPCYRDEVHLILISGNMVTHQLDTQARAYADIAAAVLARFGDRFPEGAIAVSAPPADVRLLWLMREHGITTGVFNLEAFGEDAFSIHCPGKARIGRERYLDTLRAGVLAFGRARSWCNFVLGLEPPADLLKGCEELAQEGINPGANVLHLDHGASLNLQPPDFDTIVNFYRLLGAIGRRFGMAPFYCERALRTSLANEAYDGRLG